jgi:hypothetical protein
MSGSKKNARIEELRKFVEARWPEWTVLGNKPYVKGTVMVKRGTRPKFGLRTPKNYDMDRIVHKPGFDPENWKCYIQKGLLNLEGVGSEELERRKMFNHMRDCFIEFRELYSVFGKEVHTFIPVEIESLRKGLLKK